MTNVSNASRPPQPSRAEPARQPDRPAERQPSQARQPMEDRSAMSEAMASARRRLGLGAEQPPQGKQPKGGAGALKEGRETAGKGQAEARAAGGDAALFERARYDRQSEQQGYALPGGTGQLVTVPMPQMPSPIVDPSAFAQMMRDLWTRENGKGSKEVRVRFGDGAWPATGARLNRVEGGALEIALMVADGGAAYNEALPELQAQLGRSGLAIERLTIADDDGIDG